MLQAEIETLKARKSIVECIRETFAQAHPVSVLKRKVRRKVVEITISEDDFEQLKRQASSTLWIEKKIIELRNLGDRLWNKANQTAAVKAATQRAEEAELRCRRLEYEIQQLRKQLRRQPRPVYILDNSGDREIDYIDRDDREID